MKRTRVKSSSLTSVGYDAAAGTLEVEFKSGLVYQYFLVPASVHAAFLAADSLGAYLNEHIKPGFPFEQVQAARKR